MEKFILWLGYCFMIGFRGLRRDKDFEILSKPVCTEMKIEEDRSYYEELGLIWLEILSKHDYRNN